MEGNVSSKQPKYKIVLFNDSLSGGAGKSILTLAETLKNNSVEVHVVLCEKKIDYRMPKYFSLHILSQDNNQIYNKKYFSRKLQEKLSQLGDIDIVMSNSSPSNKILSLLNLSNAYHCVRSAETKSFFGMFKSLRAALRNRKYQKLYTDKNIITVSRGLEELIIRQLKAKPKSIQTIYNPFNFSRIAELAEENNIEIPKDPYLIHVGRLDLTHKRQDILLKAYKKANVPYKLVLLGDGSDKEKIRSIIKGLSLEDKVLLAGFSNNPYPWIKKAKLFILSSDFEGFPRVIPEALSLKTPVVSTDCPTGPSEILVGRFSDYLVPTDDVDALASGIVKALAYYPQITNDIFERFEDNIIVKQYIKLMEYTEKSMKSKK